MTRFDAVIYEGRHCGQRYHRLRNEIARCRLQLRGELIAFALASVALEDNFAEAFKKSRGKVPADLKLGF